jgi:dihydrofolate synthase/folylpolyglutamate synthase
MTYQETIDYLFSRLPMFSRIGSAAYKPSLDNTILLCERLGNPQHKFKSVHIAGTNGKGSVSHMLAAILQNAGYKTGLYTSPHLKDFGERIKVNGSMVRPEFVASFTEKITPVIDEIEPSFFEITVAMAFEYFAAERVDIAVIETGLGGRLDSTNIVTPLLSVITNIGWDHMNLLGDTLEKIAFEKAGIIKKNIPVVIGEVNESVRSVFERVAGEHSSPITFASETKHVTGWHWEKHELVVEIAEPHRTDHRTFHLDLPGLYQTKNLPVVLETCAQLHQMGWHLDEDGIKAGLKNTRRLTGLHGRWEVIRERPMVVLDVSHNEDGLRQVMKQVVLTEHRELHMILGVVKDKSVNKMLQLLPRTAHYYFTQSQIPRALKSALLQQEAAEFGLQGKAYEHVDAALRDALARAHEKDLVLVCGSVFLVGEVTL